ncbi:CDGSH iron-sulfur domain-containing protein [Streptomyces sp. CA-250714]|uniref:CDGSH iron-sulfur domain-containing protein n=1 Tax=Streptomyces sp. CA-250714 TaxID=3240060 RepID=UPI003D8B720A
MPTSPAEENQPRRDRRRVTLEQGGPMLVEGPVEVRLDDGRTLTSDRFTVALCTCRRSRTYPWCDTSHRRRARPRPGSRTRDAQEPTDRQDGQGRQDQAGREDMGHRREPRR